MITLLAVLGGLGFLGLVVGATLYLFDTPARSERLRMQLDAEQTAWNIQNKTRAAIEQMLDEARNQQR